jgi:hypothetical protein
MARLPIINCLTHWSTGFMKIEALLNDLTNYLFIYSAPQNKQVKDRLEIDIYYRLNGY